MPKLKTTKQIVTWNNNAIQFPRLIAELEAAGAFTDEVYKTLSESMGLEYARISELVDRAQFQWENAKSKQS